MASSPECAAKPSPTSPARDILVLSILVRDVRPIDSVSMRTTEEAKAFGNLSFMMSPGGKEEAGASVGVIGRLDGEGLHAVVMSRNANFKDPSKYDIKAIPASTQRGQKLLKRGWARPQRDFFKYHAYMVDATSVIQCFCAGSHARGDVAADSFATFAFIVSRCYRKLLARVENSDRVWGGKKGTEYDHPTSYIRRAYEGTNPPSVPEAYFDLALPLDVIKNILTGRWGLEPSSSSSASSNSPLPGSTARSRRFKVSNDDALQWSRAVHGSVQDIRVFLDVLVKSTDDKPCAGDDYLGLLNSMMVLRALLSAGVVAHLITEDLEKELSDARNTKLKRFDLADILKPIESTVPTGQGNKSKEEEKPEKPIMLNIDDILSKLSNPPANETSTEEPATSDTKENDNDDIDESLSDAYAEQGETPKSHVIRNLETLLIPLHNITVLRRLRRAHSGGSSAVTVYHFQGAACKLKATNSRAAFKDALRVAKEKGVTIPANSRFGKVVEHPEKAKLNGALHAEAELMALVWSVRAHPDAVKKLFPDAYIDLENMSEGDAIPIGVSKKACYCCHLLARKLASSELAENHPTKFILPGTHATVFPWVPPDGLPLAVLQSIRDDLKAVLAQAINRTLQDTGSAQSSPFSATSELEDEDWAEAARAVIEAELAEE